MAEYLRLLSLSSIEFERFDLVEMNLLVAKSIAELAQLDIPRYQNLADEWADAVRKRLGRVEREYWKTPQDWDHSIHLFRLGVLCGYLEHAAGIAYREDQRAVTAIANTDPADLFLNGVMDTRRGTCASMAALHVAIGRRLGWPVSLACVGSHFVCRFDNGNVTHNIEATQAGFGGFKCDPDEYLIRLNRLPPPAIRSGSDLRALSKREMLGVFLGLRGRHMRDTGQFKESESDYLLARYLFPTNRRLYLDAMGMALPRGLEMFEPGELGSPVTLAEEIMEHFGPKNWELRGPPLPMTVCSPVHSIYFDMRSK